MRLETKALVPNSLSKSLQAAQALFDEAKEEWAREKLVAPTKRKQFLEQLAQDMEEAGDGTKAKNIRTLHTRAQQRLSARRIRSLTKPPRQCGINQIQVPVGENWEVVTSKEGIEDGCLAEAKSRFTQSKDTPLLMEPLLSEVGNQGFGPAVPAILAGTYVPPPGTDDKTAAFLHEMASVPNIPTIPTGLPTSSYRSGWEKMKERTSSGPSGLHFGHIKACMMDIDLADFQSALSNIPYATGYSPQRWQKGTNVFIEKTSRSDMVTKLRIILLYEADFNFNNKCLGRAALFNAHDHQAVAPEQHGSSRSAIEHGINK